MTGNKIAVLNNTKRIITLRGQTKTTPKGAAEPRRFKTHLQPGVLNMVPVGFWNIYKRQKIVEAWLAQETLIGGKDAQAEEKKKTVKQTEQFNATEAAENAALAQLEDEAGTDEQADE